MASSTECILGSWGRSFTITFFKKKFRRRDPEVVACDNISKRVNARTGSSSSSCSHLWQSQLTSHYIDAGAESQLFLIWKFVVERKSFSITSSTCQLRPSRYSYRRWRRGSWRRLANFTQTQGHQICLIQYFIGQV